MSSIQEKEYVWKKLGYKPSIEQARIHYCQERVRMVAGGERSGKSFMAVMDFMSRFWEGSLYWLIAADYERTRAEYEYIKDALDLLEFPYTATKCIDPGEIVIADAIKIQTKSAKDSRKIAMLAPDGIIGCEASQLDIETYRKLRARIAEKRGWLLLEGTFESSLGWYPEKFAKWQLPNSEGARSFSMPTWSNLKVFPGGRNDPEIKAIENTATPEWFMERFGGVPCPPKGRVISEFDISTHVGNHEFDPSHDVFIWVDVGYAHFYSVLAAQYYDDHVYIIDEIFERGLITSEIIRMAKERVWWKNVKGGAIDIAATQHQGMPAPSEIWLNESGVYLRSQKVDIKDGIERTRACFKINPITNEPMIYINENCTGLISELGGCPNPLTGLTHVYHYRLDKDGIPISDLPEDRYNDACKALAYGLVDLLGHTKEERPEKIKVGVLPQ
ncbi:MAG: hypothetical protein LLF82_000324 [Dehalococcoides mccartyi]|uniref:hypothetical protein n=1 Tax=Dehalococcoides mccartyi TaxID=61435 RepID=UPI00242B74FB|nr:hypothetical protein [Dehalococcoides mccartyi]MCF7634858.1 hypothetical protein [Dehalococcoides mccartyi]